MRGGLGNENGVAPPETLPGSKRAHPRPPVSGATLFRSVRGASTSCRGGLICAVGGGIGGVPVIAKSCCALGCVKSCRSRSPDDAPVAMREDIGEVSAVGTGQDLAASEIVQECCQ
jgi:hypothetical protein